VGSPITTYFRVCDGVRVRFADTRADADTTVLLLAPWPESLWAFRRIWDHQYLDDLLPNSELHPLDAGHFAWEQAAEDYGRLVVDWVSGGYRRVAAGEAQRRRGRPRTAARRGRGIGGRRPGAVR
jgi:hypothetical protein